MADFRDNFIAEVRSALSRNDFRPEDFDIDQRSDDEFKILRIIYRYVPSFYFQIQVRTRAKTHHDLSLKPVETESAGTIHTFSSPGHILNNEHARCSDSGRVIRSIAEWTDRITDELLAIPANRRAAEHRQALDELTARFAVMEEGYFTAEEADELISRLDAFESQFAAGIRTVTENQEQADYRIAELHSEIEHLKRQIEVLDRKGWTKSALVRMANWLRDPTNRQLLKSGGDLAKSILLPPSSSGGSGTP